MPQNTDHLALRVEDFQQKSGCQRTFIPSSGVVNLMNASRPVGQLQVPV
jgi:hypothetical protein